ncbi:MULTISPECIES: TetR/AcrR family transcriptional regulator [Catenuloplanes]|uniref:AcrR family transcriptional regulator n=1 Tax=Catenuloplanes niger TaxID=587534 RepID=A0AAE4CQA5_9ACTN|nr:TetR/AcrR family transcriptional regulator [Catenuloplanes niger]MDR7321596.1 AcrR family transcriptional regulator [Catenuloplanes niger]
MTVPTTASSRPLRRDAVRNREQILSAAAAAFAERGANVDVREIARAAGVGMGTLYRHFATKDQLLGAVIKADFDAWMDEALQAARESEPWAGLAAFLEDALARQCADRALMDGVFRVLATTSLLDDCRSRMSEVINLLLDRARAAGELRPDVGEADIALTMMAIGKIIELTEAGRPGLWRRQLRITLDGLRAHGHTPITEPPITIADLDAAVCHSIPHLENP